MATFFKSFAGMLSSNGRTHSQEEKQAAVGKKRPLEAEKSNQEKKGVSARKQLTKNVSAVTVTTSQTTHSQANKLVQKTLSQSFANQFSQLSKQKVPANDNFEVFTDMDLSKSDPHRDIDADDQYDPRFVSEYVAEIYENLRACERKHLPVTNYIETIQPEITPDMRKTLIDWIVMVGMEFQLLSDTIYTAINYIDRYLSVKKVVKSKVQLVAVTAMMLAAKYEETMVPPLVDWEYIADSLYPSEEILVAERNMLTVLDFNLTVATPKVFLRRFLKAANANLRTRLLANYLCELAVVEYKFIHFVPSKVAASCVYLAQYTLGIQDPWGRTLEHYSEYTAENLSDCVFNLWNEHRLAHTFETQSVVEKYCHEEFGQISLVRATSKPPPMCDTDLRRE